MAHITNKLRGLVAALVAVFAALALVPGTAMAAITDSSTTTVSISGVEAGSTVTLHKIIETTYDQDSNSLESTWVKALDTNEDGVLDYTASWEDPVSFDKYAASPDDAEGTGNMAQAIAGAVNYARLPVAYTDSEIGEDEVAQFSDVAMGQYFVKVVNPDNSATQYQNMIVSVEPDVEGSDYVLKTVTVDAKCAEIHVDKKVDDKDDADNYAKGDIVPFSISTAFPTYPDNAVSRVFKVGDSLTGMELVVDDGHAFTIEVNGTEVTPSTEGVTVKKADGAQVSAFADLNGQAGFTVEFSNDYILAHDNEQVEISYSGKITSAEYTKPDTNKVTVEFSRNPYDDTTSETEDITHITFYAFGIKKIDGAEQSTALKGAEFSVYKADQIGSDGQLVEGATPILTGLTTDDQGLLTIDGLGEGTYYLVETKAPIGYQLDSTPHRFVIENQSPAEDTFAGHIVNAGDPEEIVNTKNPVLPVTGGAGTVALTAAGVVLIAGAAAFIVRSRKQN